MNFALSEEQQMLQQMAKDFVGRESSLKRIRALREDPLGFSREVWRKMAELGMLGITLPESDGGQGMGMVEMVVVMEELGRGLMPEPMLSTVLLGANALRYGGSAAQRKAWLPRVAAGEALLTLAYQEVQSRYEPFDVVTQAKKSGKGWTLQGEKIFVPDAEAADVLVVTARTAGGRRDREGVELFLVPRKAKGVSLELVPSMDWRKRYRVKLAGVALESDARLEGERPPDQALEAALDRATTGISAEMLGAMNQAFALTLDYLKTR
ncbi:MAG: acyl-CoA/acyl-ACP dehydrogenase, partial [Deltaproteobacteria bacterium]|nr:acyl-CoA/acyl-ACP dehydrogenase [Deltaproteobacteria bacterium]